MSILYTLLPTYLYILMMIGVGLFLGHIIAMISMFVFNFYIRKDKNSNLIVFGVLGLLFSIFVMTIIHENFEKVNPGETVYSKSGVVTLEDTRYIFGYGSIIVAEDFNENPSENILIEYKGQSHQLTVSIKDLKKSQLSGIVAKLHSFDEYNTGQDFTNEDMSYYIQNRLKPLIIKELESRQFGTIDEVMNSVASVISTQTYLNITLEKSD